MAPTRANVTESDFPAPDGPADRGLLEQPLLRVGPEDGRARRVVRDAEGRPVGVCQRLAGPWLWRWLGPCWQVAEAGDQPLVFSVVPALSLARRQVVRDAEGELIGTTAPRQLHDRWGRLLMRRRPRADGRSGLFVGPAGQAAARWSAAGGEVIVEVHEGWLPGPFERMLVLAATLAEI